MPFITQGKTNLKYILIVVVLAVIVGGGIFGYYYSWIKELEAKLAEIELRLPIVQSKLNLKTTKLATIPKDYEDISEIIFSPDGKQVIYKAKKEGKWFVVANEKEGSRYDHIEKLSLSPDGQKVAYIGYKAEKTVLVIGEKEMKEVEISRFLVPDFSLAFSPDSNKIAYIEESIKKGYRLVVMNLESESYKESNAYDYIFLAKKAFSPDSQKIVYAIGEGEYTMEGEEYGERVETWPKFSLITEDLMTLITNRIAEPSVYAIAEAPIFGSDGQKIAYISWYEPGKRSTCGVVVIGKEGKVHRGEEFNCYINYPTELNFTPQSEKIVYLLGSNHRWFAVIEDQKIELIEDYKNDIEVRQLVFIKNDQKFAYIIDKYETYLGDEKSRKSFVRVNNKEFGPYDDVGRGDPVLSSDGKYIVYGVRDGNELWWIVEEVK